MSTYRIPVVACRLARERILLTADAPIITTAQDAAKIAHLLLGDLDREQMAVLLLNTRHRCVGANIVSMGGLSSAPVHPREVFKPALINDPPAAAVILCHNHPGGSAEASLDDEILTGQLRDVGRLIGIEVLDHIITTPAGEWVSLRALGAAKSAAPLGTRETSRTRRVRGHE